MDLKTVGHVPQIKHVFHISGHMNTIAHCVQIKQHRKANTDAVGDCIEQNNSNKYTHSNEYMKNRK